jgi:hypothetical protein
MVRVVGNIRDYEGARHVLVFEVFPIEDFNQLTHHLLDVIFTHCKHSKGPIPVCFDPPYSRFSQSCQVILMLRRCDVLQGSAQAKSVGSFSTASPAGRTMGGGVGGMNANMGMQGGRMGGGASLNGAMKSEAQGITEMVNSSLFIVGVLREVTDV